MTERLTRVQRRQRQTQERIFRVAMDLFLQKGFEQTTIADITEAADIGKGTFFSYFSTKEAIFGHLGHMLTEQMAETVAECIRANIPAAEILGRLFRGAALWHQANRPLSEQVIMAGIRTTFAMETDSPSQERMRNLLAEIVRTGQACGEFSATVRPDDAAVALTGIYFATLLAWVQRADARPLPQMLESALSLVLQGLRS